MDLALVQSVIAILTAVAGAAVIFRERARWKSPTSKLLRALAEARSGEGPIDAVHHAVPGTPLDPLAEQIALLLHDLRQCHRDNKTLDAEMSQRVANRTDALERSLASLKNQAQRDPLTGLYNRRAMELAFPKVLEQCRAAGANLHVLMIDLDRFKQVNDTLGHVVGDQWLTDIGKLIRSHIRETDFAFRYGGDEFVVLLPGADSTAARALGQRLAQLAGELGSTLKIRPGPGLSVGMTSLSEHPTAPMAELIRLADAELYAKKQTRRSA